MFMNIKCNLPEMKNFRFLCFIFVFLCLFTLCQTSELVAKYSRVKFSSSQIGHRLHFDGLDSIYIFGGCSLQTGTQILKYSLETDTISKVGSLPARFCHGSLFVDPAGNVLLFGADLSASSYERVLKYYIKENTTKIIASFPYKTVNHPIIYSRSGNSIYLFGFTIIPKQYRFYDFDLETYNFTNSLKTTPINFAGAEAVLIGDRAFIFAPQGGRVWEFNPETLEFTPIGGKDLPKFSELPGVVSDGSVSYLIVGAVPAANGTERGILRFDPLTNSTSFIPVGNWPLKDPGDYYLTAPQCTFVGRLERIYCIGGISYKFAKLGLIGAKGVDVFWIQLGSKNGDIKNNGSASNTTFWLGSRMHWKEMIAHVYILVFLLALVKFGIARQEFNLEN